MKRNNLFFVAYVLLIFICVIVKAFWDFPLWNTIVAAITVASLLLSMADLLKSQSTKQHEILIAQDDYTESATDEIEMIKKAIIIRQKQGDSFHESLFYSKEDNDSYHNSQMNLATHIEENLKKTQDRIKRYKKIIRINNCISSVLYVLGFLALFCIICFDPISSFFSSYQDVLTVLAFGTILLTQLYEDVMNDRYKTIIERNNNSLNMLDAIRKNYEDEVIHNAD